MGDGEERAEFADIYIAILIKLYIVLQVSQGSKKAPAKFLGSLVAYMLFTIPCAWIT